MRGAASRRGVQVGAECHRMSQGKVSMPYPRKFGQNETIMLHQVFL